MFKVLFLILALALYGAYALLEKAAGGVAPPLPVAGGGASAPWQDVPAAVGQAVASTALKATGMVMAPLVDPESCSSGALSPDRIYELYALLPEAQQHALGALLAQNPQLPLQPYAGQAGVGLCVPSYQQVILLPQGVVEPLWALIPAR